MAYASGRVYCDADSHIMELPDFLHAHADAHTRAQLPPLSFGDGTVADDALAELAERGGHSAEHRAELVAQGDALLKGPKLYQALGAFDAGERSTALDLLGFHRQLVFATFGSAPAFNPALDIGLRYGAAAAHNRAMAAFTGADKRLLGVGAVCLDDPERATQELEHLLKLGLKAVWIPHRDCGGRSPGHDDLDPFWARLQEAGMPFVLHVGGAALQIEPVWMNTGRPPPTDWLGGGENVRGKDMTTQHHGPERFISVMLLDGVFERFPKLTGAAVELGAGFVPALLTRLDWIHEIWQRTEPELRAFRRKPSEQLAEQFAFTPYVYEDIGAFIRASNAHLYLFSSDYPHTEGGRNPIGRFEASLGALDDAVREQFYAQNFARVFGTG